MASKEALTLSAIPERKQGTKGQYQSQFIYPVISEAQTNPEVAAALRAFELRTAMTVDGETGLVYRMLHRPGWPPNSWLVSADTALEAAVHSWGRISSDHTAGTYRFEPLNLPGRPAPVFPDLGDLIDELLADYVIDRLDHPVLQKLLGDPVSTSVQQTPFHVESNEEEDDDIY